MPPGGFPSVPDEFPMSGQVAQAPEGEISGACRHQPEIGLVVWRHCDTASPAAAKLRDRGR